MPTETKTDVAPANDAQKWDLRHLAGSREGVKNAIQQNPKVPDLWKSALCAQIDSLPAEFNRVSVDAYCQIEKGQWIFDMHIFPRTEL